MGSGDLLNLLVERDVFDKGFTRFYVAEVWSFFLSPVHDWHARRYTRYRIMPKTRVYSPRHQA
jgi:serine/threonine-protein kinase LATS1/2